MSIDLTSISIILIGISSIGVYMILQRLRINKLKKTTSDIISDSESSKISLHSLLKFSGVVMGVLALNSIVFWLADLKPILNPFISLLTLVASPFVYVMGVCAKVR